MSPSGGDDARGGAPSFQAVYTSMRERVFGLSLRILGERAEAEDATQATFVQVHRFLAAFRGEAAVETWVFRIALREAGLRAKQRARRAEVLGRSRPEGGAEGRSEGTERREQIDGALAALQELTEDQRAVLSLMVMRELPVRRVAEILGVPEGTVWSRAHAARRRLAEVLGTKREAGPHGTGPGERAALRSRS